MLCHGGTLERRRGDNYLGGGYTSPAGMEGDTHLSLGMECADCHRKGADGMGDMTRKAGCSDCHLEAEEAPFLGDLAFLFHLKTKGPQTTARLAARLGITSMGARQHLQRSCRSDELSVPSNPQVSPR